MVGETFGSYRVTHKLAEGGMGEVFAAEHTLLGRPAAIKVLRPDLSSRTDMVERFFNEARATTSIRHAGIVEVFDFGYDAHGNAYIVMELLLGESLGERIADGGLPAAIAVSIVRRVAHAVGAAHQQGIIHRDLKPDNVFLVADGDGAYGVRPKVLDFGIAKLARRDQMHTRTQTGALLGTPMYMSPEQCKGSGHVDHRSDIYALGCILYELLVGEPPFLADGFGEIIALHITSDATPVGMRVDVPAALDVAVMRCLAKAPDDRFQSAHELVMALDAAMGMVTHTPAPPPIWIARPKVATRAGTWSMPPPAPETKAAAVPGVPTVKARPAAKAVPAVNAVPAVKVSSTPTTLGGTASEAMAAVPAPRSQTLVVVGLMLTIAAVVAAVFVVAAGEGGTAAGAKASQPQSQPQLHPKPQPKLHPAPQPETVVIPLVDEEVAVIDAGVATVVAPEPEPRPRKRAKPRTTPTAQTAPRPSSALETDL
jgi:hypothetical protein